MRKLHILMALMLCFVGAQAQHAYHSVLSEHTWYKMNVSQEGIYKLDYATLASMGIDMGALNPNQIRIFGNEAGAYPEKNADPRPDDLTEMAIWVNGAEDGRFDEDDFVLFYGQEPTRWTYKSGTKESYERERNYYTNVTHYFLCVDSGVEGLRIGNQATLPVTEASTVISDFNYVAWHEEELMTPYFQGQNWYGEMIDETNPVLDVIFDLPNLIADKPTLLTSKVLGRVDQGSMHYNLWVNDNLAVDNAAINAHGDYTMGVTHNVVGKQVALQGESATCRLEIVPEGKNASLYLDYFELSCWRRLKREGKELAFRIMPSQFGEGSTAIWIQNVDNNYQLWDVSDVLHPVVQEGLLSGGSFVFATDQPADKRYHLFRSSAYRSIEGFEPVANQDVHFISDADMIIITPQVFREQAEELAEMHRQWDNMLCLVVDVNEIANEFATGTPDPSGIRDFVRMVYFRSGGQLKYITLFGKASADYRDLKGYGKNFVPTYETMQLPHNQEKSFCSDDYYVLMDANDGANCAGLVDLAIGRLPVSTVEEAEKVLEKIRHYHDVGTMHGDWKMNHLLMADDDSYSFMDQTEICGSIIDTTEHSMHQIKLYTDAYPQKSTSSGPRHPAAHDELMRLFDQGFLGMHYAGHAGYLGLTSEAVFTVSDIAELTNYDRLPFLLTATCEFSVFDDPLKISAGEQMFLSDKGGAIALLTAPRPTQGPNNQKLAKAVSKNIYSRDSNGLPLRFGDISRLAKSDPVNAPSNVTYVLFGDPALRISMPIEEVKTLTINGNDLHEEITLHAMSMVNIEGEIRTVNGTVDRGFSGEVWVKLYDKESRFATLGQESAGVHNFTFYNDVLYRGRASVTNGKFNVSFQVPADINMSYGTARIGFYAYDSIRRTDAMGVFESFSLGGVDPAMVHDNEGPQIKFYWNTPEFENGDVVARDGVLYAELYDAQGISHYDFTLGRNIILNSNLPGYNNMNLNEKFEPALDDFRRGTITLPITGLEPGTYEFSLKVWDTQDNASEARLWFHVQDGIFLSRVVNYPNPFSEETNFTLAHDGKDGQYAVNIDIYDMMGHLVANINQHVASTGNVMEPIHWDGKDAFGNHLRTGIYLYRFSLTDEEGNTRTVSQRMAVSR